MVNLQKSGDSAVKIVFTDSDHYLYGNGEIEVPVNSLLLVIDESEMVTFKKLSGDPFLSFRADNSNLGTKAAIEQFYKENMVGAAGISEEEVQDMIDESISGKADTAVVNQAISEATQAILSVSGDVQTKVATSDFNAYSAATETALNAKADTSALNDYYTKSEVYNKQEVDAAYGTTYQALTAHTANTTVHVTSLEKDAWNAKQDALSAGTGIEISGNVISATGGGGMDDDTQQLISTAFNDLNDRKADLTELSKYQKKGDYVETPTLADYMTNDAFDEYVTAKERIISGALNDLNDKFGGLKLVKISQTDYDNLATKDNNTLYIINNVI